MPTSIAAVLVLLLAIVPGSLGVYFFSLANGLDWRKKDWQAAVQYIGYSATGLLLYVLLAVVVDGLPAIHVLPSTYATLRADQLGSVLMPYFGHMVCAAGVGLVAAYADRLVAHFSKASPHPCAWDDFLAESLHGRWAVVTLTSGDVYAGIVRIADGGVPSAERDLVLKEPSLYDPERENYIVTPYHDIYFPASIIQNVGTLALDSDWRIGPASGQPLFKEHDDAGGTKASPAATPAAGPIG